ncbi:unnamed protein product [Darwinula stevensoni]|uniref:Uncharacterized protein n=1 Tax=Darwinula stevensoni TaxID=69355 RepID=A0A7R8XKJ1_9CRUS|nr:unnamed protein product [Darwinula stevensoni]CAG0895297.1 unnamed protein product [Darwinula stevensoni]
MDRVSRMKRWVGRKAAFLLRSCFPRRGREERRHHLGDERTQEDQSRLPSEPISSPPLGLDDHAHNRFLSTPRLPELLFGLLVDPDLVEHMSQLLFRFSPRTGPRDADEDHIILHNVEYFYKWEFEPGEKEKITFRLDFLECGAKLTCSMSIDTLAGSRIGFRVEYEAASIGGSFPPRRGKFSQIYGPTAESDGE